MHLLNCVVAPQSASDGNTRNTITTAAILSSTVQSLWHRKLKCYSTIILVPAATALLLFRTETILHIELELHVLFTYLVAVLTGYVTQ